jgi:hypothetical protein
MLPDTLRPGQSLTTSLSDYIESAGGGFRLSFYSTENSTKHYVVIYMNIKYRNIVWVANREHPFPNSSAVLTVDPDGNLVISDGVLLHMVTNTSGGNDSYARLLDTGNLILTNRASLIFWQSFDYPTETILPGMKIKDARTGWSLKSWKGYEDPAPGLFSLQYLGSRKELILMEGSEPYWNSSVNGVLAGIDGEYITWRSDYTNEIRRIFLDMYGNLLLQRLIGRLGSGDNNVWYSYKLSSCGAYPVCGVFSICNDTADPTCDCLPGFKTDLQHNNNVSCISADTIRPGQSLNTSETIVSAKGITNLVSFLQKRRHSIYVGIWYYGVSDLSERSSLNERV